MKPEHLEKATEYVQLLRKRIELKNNLENIGNVRAVEFTPHIGKPVMLDKHIDEIGDAEMQHLIAYCIEHLKKEIRKLEIEIEKL